MISVMLTLLTIGLLCQADTFNKPGFNSYPKFQGGGGGGGFLLYFGLKTRKLDTFQGMWL